MRKGINIYICHTYHHVVMSCIRAMQSEHKNDIVITTRIPEYNHLIQKLKESEIYENVYFIDSKSLLYPEYGKSFLDTLFFLHKRNRVANNDKVDIPFKQYDNVYLFNSWTGESDYLQDNHIKYHLIEDGVDQFKQDTKLRPAYWAHVRPTWKNKLKTILNYSYSYYGRSKYCIDIEVNSKEGVRFPFWKKIIVNPKKEIYASLSQDIIDELKSIFMDGEISLDSDKPKMILLTQPLFIDHDVDTEEKQGKIYQAIIEQYQDQFQIYIKPHPRDMFDYTVFEQCKIIKKEIPTEIMNLDKSLTFDVGVTLYSSSIFLFSNIKNKISLGIEYCQSVH